MLQLLYQVAGKRDAMAKIFCKLVESQCSPGAPEVFYFKVCCPWLCVKSRWSSPSPSPHLTDQPDQSWQQSLKRNRVPPLSSFSPSLLPLPQFLPPFTPVHPAQQWNQCIHCLENDPKNFSSQDPSRLPRQLLLCCKCEMLHQHVWTPPPPVL